MLFFLISYLSNGKKGVFMCCANGSFMWSDSLFLPSFFFLTKETNPGRGKQKQDHTHIHYKQNREG